MTLAWIANRLHMGAWMHVSNLLHLLKMGMPLKSSGTVDCNPHRVLRKLQFLRRFSSVTPPAWDGSWHADLMLSETKPAPSVGRRRINRDVRGLFNSSMSATS
jgi:hypothetical protein